jgi:hypothetical protein
MTSWTRFSIGPVGQSKPLDPGWAGPLLRAVHNGKLGIYEGMKVILPGGAMNRGRAAGLGIDNDFNSVSISPQLLVIFSTGPT